jgi:hypothetical protein
MLVADWFDVTCRKTIRQKYHLRLLLYAGTTSDTFEIKVVV